MTMRRAAPHVVKLHGRRLSRRLGAVTAGLRMRPAFVIVGAQRCGTTSLFRALLAHPAVLPPVFHKGVNYFDLNYHRGEEWYLGHFPVERLARMRHASAGVSPVTFEASGYYMYHPLAPSRMAQALPSVRLVMLLRDPVERAYSAHRHELARGFETESFERALELEDVRLDGEVDRIAADPLYESHSHRHHSYRHRGHYAEQLVHLRHLYDPDQILVVESEAFFQHPQREYARVLRFLDLPSFEPTRFERWNGHPRAPIAADTRERLADYFTPHDEHLADLLGHRPGWR